MELVWLTMCAGTMVSVFAFPTTEARTVMNVHRATMDIQTVLVSGFDSFFMCPSVTMIDKPNGFA